MLKIHDVAPDFTLPSTSGAPIRLKSLRGRKVVLYFYPRDDTPGCTRQACGFRDNLARLKAHGAVVIGVSRDKLASHDKFRAKYELPFELASDADNIVAKSYAAYGQKMMYGKAVLGTIRSTFLIDELGKIAALWSPVKVDGHVDAVLAALSGGSAENDRGASAKATRVMPRAEKARRPSRAKTPTSAPKRAAKKTASRK